MKAKKTAEEKIDKWNCVTTTRDTANKIIEQTFLPGWLYLSGTNDLTGGN